jgi:hypothetical protein
MERSVAGQINCNPLFRKALRGWAETAALYFTASNPDRARRHTALKTDRPGGFLAAADQHAHSA